MIKTDLAQYTVIHTVFMHIFKGIKPKRCGIDEEYKLQFWNLKYSGRRDPVTHGNNYAKTIEVFRGESVDTRFTFVLSSRLTS